MEPTPELAAQLDRDRREAARAMTFEQRARTGLDLFDIMAEAMRAGIRMQNPTASEAEVFEMFVERLRKSKRREELH